MATCKSCKRTGPGRPSSDGKCPKCRKPVKTAKKPAAKKPVAKK